MSLEHSVSTHLALIVGAIIALQAHGTPLNQISQTRGDEALTCALSLFLCSCGRKKMHIIYSLDSRCIHFQQLDLGVTVSVSKPAEVSSIT